MPFTCYVKDDHVHKKECHLLQIHDTLTRDVLYIVSIQVVIPDVVCFERANIENFPICLIIRMIPNLNTEI